MTDEIHYTSGGVPLWRMKNGEHVAVNRMEEKHLRNSIRLLRRRIERLSHDAYGLASWVQGEMASYYADQNIDKVEELRQVYDAWCAIFNHELEKRGLRRE